MGSEQLILSQPPHYKTPTDDSSFPLTSLSAQPLPPFSSLWHLFLSLTTAAPSLASFHCEEKRRLRTLKWRQADRPCTTCLTCKASGGLQSIIRLSSPVTAERHESLVMVWFELPELCFKTGLASFSPFNKVYKNAEGGIENGRKPPSKFPAVFFYICFLLHAFTFCSFHYLSVQTLHIN